MYIKLNLMLCRAEEVGAVVTVSGPEVPLRPLLQRRMHASTATAARLRALLETKKGGGTA